MSSALPCECPGTRAEKMAKWSVTKYKFNNSVFAEGGNEASDYSEVTCNKCHGHWRTKALYVEELMDAEDAGQFGL